RRIELGRRDDFPADAGRGPPELSQGAAPVFVKLHLEVIKGPGLQCDRTGMFGGRLIDPAVYDQLVINPKADPVVAHGRERVGLTESRLDLPNPTSAERVRSKRGIGRAFCPIKVDSRINPPDPRSSEVEVVIIIRA